MKPLIFALCIVLAFGGVRGRRRQSGSHRRDRRKFRYGREQCLMRSPSRGRRTQRQRARSEQVDGKPYVWVKNVTRPTMTVYSPKGKNTGVAVVVFPGGGFEGLAIDLEGTEVCDWLTSKGITCVLLKYRTPSLPYDWHCDCRPNNRLGMSTLPLEDAQRTIGLVALARRGVAH